MGRHARWCVGLALAAVCLALAPARAEPLLAIRVVGDGGRKARLYPDHVSALRAAPEGEPRWVSADLVLAKSRVVLDGVYAGIELQTEAGAEKLRFGRRAFLGKLLEALLKRTDIASIETKNRAIAYVAAALLAAGERGMNLGGPIQEIADDLVGAFEADPVRAAPLGYYAWTPQLEAVFRESRVMQTPLLLTAQQSPPARFRKSLGSGAEAQFAVAKLLSETIRQDKALLEHYRKLNALYGALWGRRVSLGPLDLDEANDLATLALMNDYDIIARRSPGGVVEWRLLPYEFTRLQGPLARAYATRDEANKPVTVEQYVGLIRSGTNTLAPPQGGGVPDRELYALEPMLLYGNAPEGAAIETTPSYRDRLPSLFGWTPTTEREARPARRLPRDAPSVQPLALEPIPTLYLRQARAASMLRRALEGVFSTSSCQQIHGLREDGVKVSTAVGPELRGLEDLLLGCFSLTCVRLQMDPTASRELQELASEEKATYASEQLAPLQSKAQTWVDSCLDDPDCARDSRSIAPVAERLDGRVECWVELGVRLLEYQLSPGKSAEDQRPVRLWGTVLVCTPTTRRAPVGSVADLRAELDRAPEGSSALRAVGAGGGQSCLSLLLKAGCPIVLVLTLVAFLLVVAMRLRTGPRYAVRRGPRQRRVVRRKADDED